MSRQPKNYVRNFLPDGLPFLPDYATALNCYNDIKPFSKGRNVGLRPLGRNRAYNRLLIEQSEIDRSIMIKHYQTYIATYYPDGGFRFNDGGRDSLSTCQALQEVVGRDHFTRSKGKIYYCDRNGHFFHVNGGLRVNPDGLVENPKTDKVYKINRERFKALKLKFKTFTDYAKQVVTLTKGGTECGHYLSQAGGKNTITEKIWMRNGDWALRVDTWGLNLYSVTQSKLRKDFFDNVENAMISDETERVEKMYPLVQCLSFCSAQEVSKRHLPQTDDYEYTWQTTASRVDKMFNELLKYRYPVLCFDLVDAEYGKIDHNVNSKYINKDYNEYEFDPTQPFGFMRRQDDLTSDCLS